MRIQRLFISQFKSFGEAELPLSSLTLLIGANAAGKSNAVEAIQILSWLAQGRRLDDIWESVQEEGLRPRGSAADLVHAGAERFVLGCKMEGAGWNTLRMAIQATASGLRLVHEEVGDGQERLYSADLISNDLWVTTRLEQGRELKTPVSDQQAVFAQSGWASLSVSDPQGGPQVFISAAAPVTAGFARTLRNTWLLHPEPARMRDYQSKRLSRWSSHGGNVSAMLWNLCQKPDQKDRVLQFVRALPEQDIRDIEFVETELGDVMVKLKESFGGKEESRAAPLLSDGTLRVLAIGAALLSVPAGSLLVLEEVDNGIHPSRARMLLDNLYRIAQERGLKVLLTSHNPALASALPLEAVPDVVYCYRDPVSGDSRLLRLEELPDYPGLMGRGSLGELMTEGALERVVKDTRTPAERSEAALGWLNDFLKERGTR